MKIFIDIILRTREQPWGCLALLAITWFIVTCCGGVIYIAANLTLAPVGENYRAIRQEVNQQIVSGKPPVAIEVRAEKCDLSDICQSTKNGERLILTISNTLKFNLSTSNLHFQIYRVSHSDKTILNCIGGLRKDIYPSRKTTLQCSHELQNLAESVNNHQICVDVVFPTFSDDSKAYQSLVCQEISK